MNLFSCIIASLSFSISRAIYFAAYSTTKERMNHMLEPDSIQVHMVSAGIAGKSLTLSFHQSFL